MNASEIKEYLGMIIDVEKNLQEQRNALSTLRDKYRCLEADKQLLNSQIDGINSNIPYVKGTTNFEEKFKWTLASGGVGLFFGVIVFIILLCFFEFGLLVIIVPSIIVIIFIIGAIVYFNMADNEEITKTRTNMYNNMKDAKIRVSAIELQIKYITYQMEKMNAIISSSQQNLKMLYDCNFIHPKYKQLYYVVLIYECFDTGRTNKLEGADGAYNMVELDSRLDRISGQLDTIIYSLGDIRGILSNMKISIDTLSSVINSVDKNLDLLSKNTQNIDKNISLLNQNTTNGNEILKKIEANSNLMKYQQERIARETEYANRINYLQGKNTIPSLSSNRPPHM